MAKSNPTIDQRLKAYGQTIEKDESLFSVAAEALYSRTRPKPIFGMPFMYTKYTDPWQRTFGKSVMLDMPILHLTPGTIHYKSPFTVVASKLVGALANDKIFPFPMDDRRVEFKPAADEYMNYLNAMASTLFNDMILGMNTFDDGDSIKTANVTPSVSIMDFLLAYTQGLDEEGIEQFIRSAKEASTDFPPESTKKTLDKDDKGKTVSISDLQNSISSPEKLAEVVDQSKINKEYQLGQVETKATADLNATPEALKVATNQRIDDELKRIKSLNKHYMKESSTAKYLSAGFTFFMDASSSASESFGNSYGESAISQEQAQQAQEARDLHNEQNFKGTLGATAGLAIDIGKELMSEGPMALFKKVVGKAFNGMKSVSGGLVSISGLYHGAISVLPEVWQSSSFSRDYRVSFKFSSPYGDPYSVFINVYLPVLSLMAMIMPRQVIGSEYIAPFIVKADAPGNFCTDLGYIADMSLQRGGDSSSWTQNGLPTSIDVSITLKDLLPQIIMSDSYVELSANRSTMLFIRNLAGLPSAVTESVSFAWQERVAAMSSSWGGGFDFGTPKQMIIKKAYAIRRGVEDSFHSTRLGVLG